MAINNIEPMSGRGEIIHSVLTLNNLQEQDIINFLSAIAQTEITFEQLQKYQKSPNKQSLSKTLTSSLPFLVTSYNQTKLANRNIPGLTPETAQQSLQGAIIRTGLAIYYITQKDSQTAHPPFEWDITQEQVDQVKQLITPAIKNKTQEMINQPNQPHQTSPENLPQIIAAICQIKVEKLN